MEKTWLKNKKKKFLFVFFLAVILMITVMACAFFGAVPITLRDIFTHTNRTIFNLRLQRIILAAVVGGALSVSGLIFQAILRNPLADPYILGVSSGGGLGVVIVMVLGLSVLKLAILTLPLSAFLGSVLTILLVYRLARIGGRVPVQNLLLSGVIVGTIFTNILVFIVWFFEDRMTRGVIWWLLGNLDVIEPKLLLSISLLGIFGTAAGFLFSRELDILSLGEEEATSLGIEVEKTKRTLLFIASLLTAVMVSVCGIIGFVGLIVPHTLRLILSNEHRLLILACFLGGAIFLVISDTFCRTIILPAEIPIGVITALIGGPLFIFLLQRKKKILFK